MSGESPAEAEKRTEPPMVSVIIPAYRCNLTVAQSVASALMQDIPVEVIVIDDGSPENTEEALRDYVNNPRVRLLKNEGNHGVAYTRNRGIREARGKYIAFLDSDDWWDRGKLKAQLKVMKERRVVLCCTGRELMHPDGSPMGRTIPVENRITYRSLLVQNCINCSSALIRADVAREFPLEYDEAHEDYILWLRILKKYGEAAGIPEPYLKYRMAANSKSGNKWKSARMTYRVYRYVGYGPVLSACFFVSYACHGVWKYFIRRH